MVNFSEFNYFTLWNRRFPFLSWKFFKKITKSKISLRILYWPPLVNFVLKPFVGSVWEIPRDIIHSYMCTYTPYNERKRKWLSVIYLGSGVIVFTFHQDIGHMETSLGQQYHKSFLVSTRICNEGSFWALQMAKAINPTLLSSTVPPPNNSPSQVLLASCRASLRILRNQKWEPVLDSNVFKLQLVRLSGGRFTLLVMNELTVRSWISWHSVTNTQKSGVYLVRSWSKRSPKSWVYCDINHIYEYVICSAWELWRDM